MRRPRLSTGWLVPAGVGVVVLVAWQLAVDLFDIPTYILRGLTQLHIEFDVR